MGASIPCILETAISSDQQGFASCIVSRDILSDNGRVVLLDKGTQIVGEYRAGLKKDKSVSLFYGIEPKHQMVSL